jgi:hypothetical protein
MQLYELAYPIEKSKDGLIIPFLLPQKQPEQGMDRDFPVTDSLLMRYKTEHTLPPDTISRFIVRHHQDIQTNENKQPIVWRRGVKLEDKNKNQALVVENDREILLYAKGATAKNYFKDLRSTLNDIFESYKSNNPIIAYKIAETIEQKPVYADDGTIMAYYIDGGLYLDATTGKDINMTTINENYDVKDGMINKGNNLTVVSNSEKVNVGSVVNYAPPEELTLETFRVLLDCLSTFLQSDKAEYESSRKDRESLQKVCDDAKKEKDPKKGWKKLVDAISLSGGVASLISLFTVDPVIAVGASLPVIYSALNKIAEGVKNKFFKTP